ncbi:MAG: ABC transporter substrate-binding protein [Acidimicrobiia bacterium]|nr:ABC transporter substrate-binding protein [Acidimicrobiia bacterium]
MRSRTARLLASALVAALAAAACSENKEVEASGGAQRRSTTTSEPDGCDPPEPVVTCRAPGGTLDPYLPESPVKAEGEPIKVGTINQETGATGAYPELTMADRAAVAFINAELAGLDGRPIQLVECDTEFSPAGSQSCAQKMVDEGVVAVVGGIDVFGTGIDVLEQNGIPFVGGIPISMASVQNPISFQFSGGSWGAMLAFADFAANELGAKRVSILYGDFGSIADAAQYGRRALESLGVSEVKMVPMPLAGADFLPLMTTAADIDPDAVISLTADTGCVPTFQAAHDLDLRAEILITGACAAPKIVDDAGEDLVEGAYFNTEGPVNPDPPLPDSSLYNAVIARYGEGVPPASAATVSFRAFMNLYVQMREIGAAALTPGAIIDSLRAARDFPSFNGHPYTCDGEQIAGLPSICSPQQILARREGGTLRQVTDWIQVGGLAERSA